MATETKPRAPRCWADITKPKEAARYDEEKLCADCCDWCKSCRMDCECENPLEALRADA